MTTEPTIVYAFLYNDCIHESAWATVSLHFTRKGAKKALKNHMKEKFMSFKDYKKYRRELGMDRPTFGAHEDWHIGEIKILE